MFKQDNDIRQNTLNKTPETIIGKGVVVTGDLTADGDIVIDGTLKGSLTTKGSLKIGIGAQIEADIEAVTGMVAGSITGKLVIHGFLELQPTASIRGDVTTEQIAIAQGATVNGAVIMTSINSSRIEDEPAIARKKG